MDMTDGAEDGGKERIVPSFWGVAGNPISHSISPKLFDTIGEGFGFSDVPSVSIQAENISEFYKKTAEIEGDLWISCTSPLKHSLFDSLSFDKSDLVRSVNQVMRKNGVWSAANTDGAGFIIACRHIGIDPEGVVLRMRGGGSTARSIAYSWALEGGRIIPVEGRRALSDGPWDSSIIESGDATIGIDLDTPPGGGRSIPLDADLQLSISYGEDARTGDFAVIMNAAQHLEAWRVLFAPETSSVLPSLSEVLRLLA